MTPTASAGPEFTTTQGNNAHAYMDQDDNNQPDFNSSPERRRVADVRLPDRPQRARAELPGRGDGEPVLREQHDPRPAAPVRVRRGVGQLPGQQLRPRRHRRRLRPRRGGRRQRHEQRHVRHAGERRRHAADADVPVAREPVRLAEQRHRRRRRHVRRAAGRASPRRPRGPGCRAARWSTPAPVARAPSTRPRCRPGTGSPSSTAGRPRPSARTCTRVAGRPDARRQGARGRPQRDRRRARC